MFYISLVYIVPSQLVGKIRFFPIIFQQSIFLHTSASSASMNSEFKNKLDEYSQCKLPEKLKTGICKAIEEHCFNSSLSVNMDITSLASLSSDLKQTFSTLLEHVYSVDSRSMMLVLKVIGLIAENGPAMSEASHQTSEQNTTPESDVRNYSTPHMRGASNSLNNNDICQVRNYIKQSYFLLPSPFFPCVSVYTF
jgi:hypothetical protein